MKTWNLTIVVAACAMVLYSMGVVIYALWATFGFTGTLAVLALPYIATMMINHVAERDEANNQEHIL